jgi:hypothetical protein
VRASLLVPSHRSISALSRRVSSVDGGTADPECFSATTRLPRRVRPTRTARLATSGRVVASADYRLRFTISRL